MKISLLSNWVDGSPQHVISKSVLERYCPDNGALLARFPCSNSLDVNIAVESAQQAFKIWSNFSPIVRGQVLMKFISKMQENKQLIAECAAIETGKTLSNALQEVNGAILLGEFFAGEGMRLYGNSLTSNNTKKMSFTIREPIGVAGLIVPANTPIANIAWKVFPALICGNAVVLKSSEDAPMCADLFVRLASESGLPNGILNLIHGDANTGEALVKAQGVGIISFTGSTAVGRKIAADAGDRMVRLSLELGGKNAMVICDDADLDLAVKSACLSAFSNAGQRCSAASRLVVMESVYDEFCCKLVKKIESIKLGVSEDCDVGPVMNQQHLESLLLAIDDVKKSNGNILCGGTRPVSKKLFGGNYLMPTLIDRISPIDRLSQKELFGPISFIYRASSLENALEIANASEYGLTSAIHTKNIDRAIWYAKKVRAGVVNINSGTYGSEPHMPFGGFGLSGNGSREPGLEALNVYSEIKVISLNTQL